MLRASHRGDLPACAPRKGGKGGSLLEIGGGKGDVAGYLNRNGYEVVLLEAEDVPIGLSRGRGLDVYKATCPQVHRIPGLSGKTFDGAFMTRVLEYPVMSEHDAEALVRSLLQVVRKGGPIIVGTTQGGPVHMSAFRNSGITIIRDKEVDRSPYLGRVITAKRL